MANLTETLIDSKFFVTPEQIGAMRTDNGCDIVAVHEQHHTGTRPYSLPALRSHRPARRAVADSAPALAPSLAE